MGHWTGIEEAANRYGVEVGELLSWQEIKDISFCKIGGTLMVDTDSIETYLDAHAVWCNKDAIRRQLLEDEYQLIETEQESGNISSFYVRLQEECFDLYPVIIKALTDFIDNPTHRNVFRSVVQGQRLGYIAEVNGISVNSVLEIFRSTVTSLRNQEIQLLSSQIEIYDQMKTARNTFRLEAIWRKECYEELLKKYNTLISRIKEMKDISCMMLE